MRPHLTRRSSRVDALTRPAALTLAAALAIPTAMIAGTAFAPPAAAASEYYEAGRDGVWQIDGRGHGHGRGLSQWGAQGAAVQGLTEQAILDFYYPGTGRANIGNPQVRVRLVAPSDARAVTFLPAPGQAPPSVTTTTGATLQGPVLTIRLSGGSLLAEVRPSIGGAVTARGTVPSGTTVDTGRGVHLGAGSAPTTATHYRGSVAVLTTNGFEVVNTLSTEEYLYGVVPREIPASWRPAALRAQAVAARTYQRAVASPTATNDICDTVSCQVYGGRSRVSLPTFRQLDGESAATNAAVDATRGQIRTRTATDTRPAFTQFSASSGGWTVAHPDPGAHPYLVSRPDPYSGAAPGDTGSRWSATLTAATVSTYCAPGGTAQALEVTSRDGKGEWGGRITGLTVHCDNGPARPGTELQRRLGMKSSWWKPSDPMSPSVSTFLLADTLGTQADRVVRYGPDGTTDVLTGDWDGDGVTGLGYREGNVLHLRQTPDEGPAQITAAYGRAEDTVLVGDWDGDGSETVAVRRGNVFHLKNTIGAGPADAAIPYGRADDEALVGDWDGDGVATPGIRRGNVFHLKNSWEAGPADIEYDFGRTTDEIVIGDWGGEGIERPAVRRGIVFHIPAAFQGGQADTIVSFGRTTDRALVGDWNGDGRDTLGVHRLVR